MKYAIFIIMTAACSWGARIETISLDLERPQRPVVLSITDATDTTIVAALKASGSDFDPTGWTGLFWVGDDAGGMTLTNTVAATGLMSWTIAAASTPTNGRYTVQIMGVDGATTEEWGRGIMSVRANPSADSLPAEWTTNVAWAVAVRAEALLRIAGDAANSNNVAAVRTELLATNAAVAVQITGLYASNATVFASVGALELGTNRWNAAAVLAGTALQPSWAATGTVANAQRLVSADGSLMWTEIENGTNWQYCVTDALDTNIISIVATSAEYNGPAAGEETVFAFNGFNEGEQKYEWVVMANRLYYELGMPQWWLDFEVGDWALQAENMDLPATLYPSQGGAVGTVTIDYSRRVITNRTQVLTVPGTLILLSEHDADADAHPTLPRHSDVSDAVSTATNHLINTYLLSSNAWFSISNETLRVHVATGGAPASVVWESAESAGGDTVDPQATNLLWQALASGLSGKADTAWGKYAPDGSANPDPAYMTFLNAPALMHAAGFQWASSGAYSVLSSTGAVAYIAGEGGEARWGIDLSSNYVGFVRGGSVTVGAIASSFATQWPGTPTGTVSIAYAYDSGDFPSLWHTPLLSLPFVAVEGVWVDNTNGTATVTAAATAASGFWQATTSRDIYSTFVAKPPARFDGGVFGATNALPVVYDSTITVTSGGKTYRIPAQEVP